MQSATILIVSANRYLICLNLPTGAIAFEMRDQSRFIKYGYKARDEAQAVRDEISKKHGKRWSALDQLPGWFPGRDSPLEPVHASFLGAWYSVVIAISINL